MNEAASETTVNLLYGKAGMAIRLPLRARATVIGKRPMKKIVDPHAAVAAALAQPIGAPSFDALVRGRKSACILICDITRPVPNHLLLRPHHRARCWTPASRASASPSSSRPDCTGPTKATSWPS